VGAYPTVPYAGPETLGSMRAKIYLWLMGDAQGQDELINDALNAAIKSGYNFMMLYQLSRFMPETGPVTFTLSQGTEQTQIITIPNPTAAPTGATVVAGALPLRTYLVSYTYVTESGSETLPSPVLTLVVPLNDLAAITAPPPPFPDTSVIGWNCYAGQNSPALQNDQPLSFGVAYQEPTTGFQDYPTSQKTPPTYNTTADNIAYINHLELQQPNGLWSAWNQADIDSILMRRYAATIPMASQYQSHAWDLINGNTLWIRPAPGLTVTPRYFYVSKPRTLRYDQALIPYQSVTGFTDYVKYKTLMDVKLALDEYLSNEGWKTARDEAKLEIINNLTQQNWAKNDRITRYR